MKNLFRRFVCHFRGHKWGQFQWEKYLPEKTRFCHSCGLAHIKRQRDGDQYFREDRNGVTWHEVNPLRKK